MSDETLAAYRFHILNVGQFLSFRRLLKLERVLECLLCAKSERSHINKNPDTNLRLLSTLMGIHFCW